MKKYEKYIGLCLLAILAGACSSEEPVVTEPNDNVCPVNFYISIETAQANESHTRSLAAGYHFSDGRSISVVKCYVYNQANGSGAAPIKTLDINISNLKGDISIPLPKNDVFDLVFLATSIPQTDASSKLYYTTTDRSLNINYSKVSCNDEEIDCFYAVKTGVSSGTAGTTNIELKRPFAQLNIGAKDYSAYEAANAVKSTSVEVKGIYNKMTLMDGNVTGSPIDVTFGASLMPANQTYPVSGGQYIAMNYLLVNQRKLVDATLTINHHNTSLNPLTMNFKNIAVERNYQTNITINSLTD